MECYTSKIYEGKNYDAVVTSYYGANSFPTDFFQVLYRPHGLDNNLWHSVGTVYTVKESALKRARAISKE